MRAAASLRRRKDREARGLFLAEGPNAVDEALRDGLVRETFCTQGQADRWAAAPGLTVVADHVLEAIADSRTPQGVVAVAERVLASMDTAARADVVVVLCGVADPGNAGTIIRAADAFGAGAVVLTEGSVDPHNPKAVRAAAGSTTHVPLVLGDDADEVLGRLRAAGHRIVVLDGGGQARIGDPGLLTPPVAVVFGAEAHGVPAAVRQQADVIAAVPMYGRAESLNLAAAAAITLYEAGRAGNARPSEQEPS